MFLAHELAEWAFFNGKEGSFNIICMDSSLYNIINNIFYVYIYIVTHAPVMNKLFSDNLVTYHPQNRTMEPTSEAI